MIKSILQGWSNYLFEDEVVKIKAKNRAKICAECPHAKKGTYQKLMPDYTLQDVQGMMCDICKCPLSTLLRQDQKKCKLNKWK